MQDVRRSTGALYGSLQWLLQHPSNLETFENDSGQRVAVRLGKTLPHTINAQRLRNLLWASLISMGEQFVGEREHINQS
jgi:hypothetical protein